jgi:hypothetical protein
MDKIRIVSGFAGILLATSLLYASPASASDGSGGNPFASLKAAPVKHLDDVRAKGIDLKAEMKRNYNYSSDFTATNSIDNGALNGASGAFTVLQNTGNGAILQNVTTVEVNFH